jgi:hypothetical protein
LGVTAASHHTTSKSTELTASLVEEPVPPGRDACARTRVSLWRARRAIWGKRERKMVSLKLMRFVAGARLLLAPVTLAGLVASSPTTHVPKPSRAGVGSMFVNGSTAIVVDTIPSAVTGTYQLVTIKTSTHWSRFGLGLIWRVSAVDGGVRLEFHGNTPMHLPMDAVSSRAFVRWFARVSDAT